MLGSKAVWRPVGLPPLRACSCWRRGGTLGGGRSARGGEANQVIYQKDVWGGLQNWKEDGWGRGKGRGRWRGLYKSTWRENQEEGAGVAVWSCWVNGGREGVAGGELLTVYIRGWQRTAPPPHACERLDTWLVRHSVCVRVYVCVFGVQMCELLFLRERESQQPRECSPRSAGSWLSCLSSSRWFWVLAPRWPGTQMTRLRPRRPSGPPGIWRNLASLTEVEQSGQRET